jgi:hypothetical protein
MSPPVERDGKPVKKLNRRELSYIRLREGTSLVSATFVSKERIRAITKTSFLKSTLDIAGPKIFIAN